MMAPDAIKHGINTQEPVLRGGGGVKVSRGRGSEGEGEQEEGLR